MPPSNPRIVLLFVVSIGLTGCVDNVSSEASHVQAKRQPAKVGEITNSIGMILVPIPSGVFQMGSPDSDKDAKPDERPQHWVRISSPFYLGKYEITQREWKAVMATEPWKLLEYVKEGDDYPVIQVSWEEAVEFCRKLSEKEGKTYRLPTEAEWEYACRGGTTSRFHSGADEANLGNYAWYDKNAWESWDKFPHSVGTKKPNGFGLHDMHGNVWEWCSDWYDADYYETSPSEDPKGPDNGTGRVNRGGGWSFELLQCRSAYRIEHEPTFRHFMLGFRVVQVQKGE